MTRSNDMMMLLALNLAGTFVFGISGGLAGVDIISGLGKGDQAALIRDLVRRPMAASRSICSMAATSRAMRSRADSYSWRSE